jgi:hypothetical protein
VAGPTLIEGRSANIWSAIKISCYDTALITRLEALRPLIADVDTGAAALLELGRQELLDGLV